ncbi:MAG: hypothetical protein QOJ03_2119 [Frankiaceae bacterium]|nr:hypothetical protein [Frankiaceae bacterium]
MADNLGVTTTPAAVLAHELQRDGARPFLTWYDDATGERVELSVATTANWAAKIGNYLADELGVGPGDDVAVLLPMHWQTAVVLLGVWNVGAAAHTDVNATSSAAVTSADRREEARRQLADFEVLTLGLEPMGVGLSQLVAAQPDDFAGPPARPDLPALVVGDRRWSHGELAAAAAHGAAHHGLDAESRVLSTLPFDTVDGLDTGLLLPLAAGGSVVLVASADESLLAERCRSERVTHTAGVTVAGVPRLDR